MMHTKFIYNLMSISISPSVLFFSQKRTYYNVFIIMFRLIEMEKELNLKISKTQLEAQRQKILLAPIIEDIYSKIEQKEKALDPLFGAMTIDFYHKILTNQNDQQTLSPIIEEFYDSFDLKRLSYFEKESQRIEEHLEKERINSEQQEKEKETTKLELIQKQKEKSLEKLISLFKSINTDYEKHFTYLANLLNINSLDELTSKFCLLYRGSENNFDANKFHELCDGKGPTLILVRSEKQKLFGGYSKTLWHSNNTFSKGSGSFLFSLSQQTKHELIQGREGYAIRGGKGNGPIFGGYSNGDRDLRISHSCNQQNNGEKSFSNLGNSYCLPNNMTVDSIEANTYLSGSNNEFFKVEEYEVFSYCDKNF